MSERTKGCSDPIENDKSYLDKLDMNKLLTNMFVEMGESDPHDEIDFVHSYFEHQLEKVSNQQKALRYVNLCSYTKWTFKKCVRKAFLVLRNNLNNQMSVNLTGSVASEFVHLLNKDLPPKIGEKINKKLTFRNYESVNFNCFYTSVFISLVFKDYIKLCTDMFTSFGQEPNMSKISAEFLTNFTQKMKTVLDTNDEGYLEMLNLIQKYLIAEEGIQKTTADGQPPPVSQISETEFLDKMVEFFLERLP